MPRFLLPSTKTPAYRGFAFPAYEAEAAYTHAPPLLPIFSLHVDRAAQVRLFLAGDTEMDQGVISDAHHLSN